MTPRESLDWEARRERQYSVYRSDRPGAGAWLVIAAGLFLLGLVFAALAGAVLDWI